MPTTTTKVSKTKANNLTRDIRRDADRVRNIIDMVDRARHVNAETYGKPPVSLEEALERSPHAMARVHEHLGQIEGTVALLRELLNLED